MNLPTSYTQYMALCEHQEPAIAPLGSSEYAVVESSMPLLSELYIPRLRGSPRPVWQVDSMHNNLAGTSVVLPYTCHDPQIFANPSNGIVDSAEYGTHWRDADLFRLSVPHATPFSYYTSQPSNIPALQQAAPESAVLQAPPIPTEQFVVPTLGTPTLTAPLAYNLTAQTHVPTPVLSPTYPIASAASSSTVNTSPKGRSSTLRARAHMHTARTSKGRTSTSSRISCPKCNKTFSRWQDCSRHDRTKHGSLTEPPFVCCGVPIEDAVLQGVPLDKILTLAICKYRGMTMVGGCWDPTYAGPRVTGTFNRKDSDDRHLQQHCCLGNSSALYFPGNARNID